MAKVTKVQMARNTQSTDSREAKISAILTMKTSASQRNRRARDVGQKLGGGFTPSRIDTSFATPKKLAAMSDKELNSALGRMKVKFDRAAQYSASRTRKLSTAYSKFSIAVKTATFKGFDENGNPIQYSPTTRDFYAWLRFARTDLGYS